MHPKGRPQPAQEESAFWFYKKINKKYWKILISVYIFPQEEFGSSLENCVTLERALGSQPAAGRRHKCYKQFGVQHTPGLIVNTNSGQK